MSKSLKKLESQKQLEKEFSDFSIPSTASPSLNKRRTSLDKSASATEPSSAPAHNAFRLTKSSMLIAAVLDKRTISKKVSFADFNGKELEKVCSRAVL